MDRERKEDDIKKTSKEIISCIKKMIKAREKTEAGRRMPSPNPGWGGGYNTTDKQGWGFQDSPIHLSLCTQYCIQYYLNP